MSNWGWWALTQEEIGILRGLRQRKGLTAAERQVLDLFAAYQSDRRPMLCRICGKAEPAALYEIGSGDRCSACLREFREKRERQRQARAEKRSRLEAAAEYLARMEEKWPGA
jgi:hypothetical protein